MTERPILWSAPMVLALLAGRKHARNGDVDLRADGHGVATGDDLDRLYSAWMRATRDALKKLGR